MLVLSRKYEEHVIIRHDISLTVCDIRGNKARLGIRAPGDWRILRGEILPPGAVMTPLGEDERHDNGGMLVLSRQRDETILIGPDIKITVVDIRGDKVRLGIDAPPEYEVHRTEVYVEVHGRLPWFMQRGAENGATIGA